MSDDFSAVLTPRSEQKQRSKRRAQRNKPKQAPKYNVILWNDDDHSYEYVEMMMLELFHMPVEQGYLIAWRVDKTGKAICLTTTKEHAELKVEQIHAYGGDPLIPRCQGAMTATIEPAE